ncbi:MAG: hypothetical protein NXI28_05230 [bacterium]|nr:hypothetical protein [bacterium]
MSSTQETQLPLLELALEGSELFADQYLAEGLAKDIPLVGTAIKICLAIDDVRNRIFLAKVVSFTRTIDGAGPSIRKNWQSKCADPTQAARIGESLLLVIDRANDLRKPQLIATIFAAFTADEIDHSELVRLTQAIDSANIEDLLRFLGAHELPKRTSEPWMRNLLGACITELCPITMDHANTHNYKPTEIGIKLFNAYQVGVRIVSSEP